MGEVANFEMEPEARALLVGYSLVDWEPQIIMMKTANKLVEK